MNTYVQSCFCILLLLFASRSVCLSVCLSVRPSVCLSVCPSKPKEFSDLKNELQIIKVEVILGLIDFDMR